jgi:hypothetical protein
MADLRLWLRLDCVGMWRRIIAAVHWPVIGACEQVGRRSRSSARSPLGNSITDVIRIGESGGNRVVEVDREGTGVATSSTAIATLSGITGLTYEEALVTNGNLVAS